jgi:Uncharacterized protein conserved in bacteria
MTRLARRLAFAVGGTALAVGVFATPASAHVGVSSPDAEPGGEVATVTFRVPNESDSATTTEFKLQLPTDEPMTLVLVDPPAGWTYTATKTRLSPPATSEDGASITEATSAIDWKAASAATGIRPGEFALFTIAVGPLPKADQVTFKAIQTYSDGTQASWIETPDASGAEPENPAPVLTLTAGQGATQTTQKATQKTTQSTTTPAAAVDSDTTDTTDTVAIILAIVGLVAGLAGLGLAIVTRRVGRTPPSDTAAV